MVVAHQKYSGQRRATFAGLFLAVAMLLLAVIPASLSAQDFPELGGRVVDEAGLLDDQNVTNLTAKLEKLEQDTTRQLVVATVNDLQGYDIADYANRLARHWQLGQAANGEAEKDNGVLLLVAPNERKVRIEVGYGLEGILTDALSAYIIEESITPKFKEGNMKGGIVSGVYQISKQLELPSNEAQAVLDALEAEKWWDRISLIVVVVLIIGIGIWIGLTGDRSGGSTVRGRRRSGVSSWKGGSSSSRSSGRSSFSGGGGSFGGGGASGGW